MATAKKIGILLIIVGICLPTATLPFIVEFHPIPNVCLTSTFFKNMGNMKVVLFYGQAAPPQTNSSANHVTGLIIPYRYLFSIGVILVGIGLSTVVLTAKSKN